MDLGQLMSFLNQGQVQPAQAQNWQTLVPSNSGAESAIMSAAANQQAAEAEAARDAAAAATLAGQQQQAAQGIAEFLAPLQQQMDPGTWNLLKSQQDMLYDPLTFDTGMTGISGILDKRAGVRADLQKDEGKLSASKRLAKELYPNNPEEQRKFILDHSMKSGITIDQGDKTVKISDLEKLMLPGGGAIPPGTTYDQLIELGAVLRDTETEGKAGKLTMMQSAQQLFPFIDSALFNEDGTPNDEVIRNAFAISLDPTPGALASKSLIGLFGDKQQAAKAGQLYQAFEQGFQAMTRTETGAAMPPEEVENTKKRFRPGPLDSPAEVRQKYNAYKFFINNAVDLMRPQDGGAPKTYGDDVKALSEDINRLAERALIQAGVDDTPKIGADGTGSDSQYDYLVEPLPEGWEAD